MINSFNVFAKVNDKNIRCETLINFKSKITQHSYVIVFSPFETDTLIPLLYNPELEVQEATFLIEEQDISVIDEMINKNQCNIQYLPEDMTFEITITKKSISDIEPALKKIISASKFGFPWQGNNMDELQKMMDVHIIHDTGEKYLAELNASDCKNSEIVPGLIKKILQHNILLTHIPSDMISQQLAAGSVTITTQEKKLLRAFEDIIVALGKTKVVRQEVENALVSLIECDSCSQELYKMIINHMTFSEIIPRDDLQNIKYNIIFRNPKYFDITTVKTTANHYYSQNDYENALKLFKDLRQTLLNDHSALQELADTLNSIGCCCVSLMKFDEAYDAFKQATSIDNKFAAAYNNWAYTLSIEADTITVESQRRQKLQEALFYINDAIQLNTEDVSFLSNKAFIEYELEQYEHVVRDFFRAQEKTTEYTDINTLLKLKIDSQLQLHIASPDENPLAFSDLYDDLQLIFDNESGEKLYFEALEISSIIKANENEKIANEILLGLVLLEFYIKELMSSIAVRNPNQEIYYYTSIGSIQKLLCDDKSSVKYRLPIFSANHMNDPSEGQELKTAFLTNVGDGALWKDLFSSSNSSSGSKRRRLDAEFTFLKAFTQNEDSLPMWVHYADSGKGCCVKVNPHFFTNFENDSLEGEKTLKTNPFDNEYRLYEVLYIDDGKIVNSVPAKVKDAYQNMFHKFCELDSIYDNLTVETQKAVILSISKMITKLKYLFKSADYAYEQEMRIVLKRPLEDFKREDVDVQTTIPTSTNLIPKVFLYTNKSASLEEIILGPKVTETDDLIPFLTMKLLELNNFNSEKVCITKSGIEYR